MSLNLRTVYQANHVLSFYWLVLLYTLLYTYHIILQLNLSECERPFRMYVPNTDCRLPDGGSVYYRDLQTMCPLCDPCGYGDFMNEDLFPELQADISAAANPADEDYRQL